MDERDLILNDLFGDRRPPPGPETENTSQAGHDDTSCREPASDATDKLDPHRQDECASWTLDHFLTSPRDQAVPPPPAAQSDAPIGEDAGWQICDLLPAVSPASRKEGRYHQKATLAELARLFAPAIAFLSLRKSSGTLTVREAWEAVPEPKPSYDRLNSIGDALGHGRGGHALQLRRGPRRGILVCQENVNACMRRMTDAEVRSLAEQLGYASRDELLTTFDNSPWLMSPPIPDIRAVNSPGGWSDA